MIHCKQKQSKAKTPQNFDSSLTRTRFENLTIVFTETARKIVTQLII